MSCINKEYKYTFIFNNDVYIADKCYSGKYGSYCTKDNITYENVDYKKEIIGCTDNENEYDNILFYNTFNFILIFSIFIALIQIFRYIIKHVI